MWDENMQAIWEFDQWFRYILEPYQEINKKTFHCVQNLQIQKLKKWIWTFTLHHSPPAYTVLDYRESVSCLLPSPAPQTPYQIKKKTIL